MLNKKKTRPTKEKWMDRPEDIGNGEATQIHNRLERECRYCYKLLVQRPDEKNQHFKAREHCNLICAQRRVHELRGQRRK